MASKDVPTRTLARSLWEKHPGVFSCVEHARGAVRRYRGQSGKWARDRVQTRESYTENGDARRDSSEFHTIPSTRILLFDIETAPNIAYVWRCLDRNFSVSADQLVQHTTVLCYAAKWLDQKRVIFDEVDHDDYTNDRAVCESLWGLFDKADIVVAHNGRAFDHPLMRTRFLAHGMAPPSSYQTVDTCKLAQKQFAFPRSKLDVIAKYLKIGHKTPHDGFKLWSDCMDGDKAAWRSMRRYNINDVILLEKVYLRLRAWDKQHPNVSIDYDDTTRCTVCGSTSVRRIAGEVRTPASLFEQFRCDSCGHVMRSRSRIKPAVSAADRMANA